MSKINTPIAIILSGILIFFGLYISDSNAKMSMDGKSCCCKSNSQMCSMNEKMKKQKIVLMKAVLVPKETVQIMNNKEMESLTELDSNSDGKISLAEYLSKPDKKFKSLDSNKDGYISKEEMSNKDKTDVHAHH